MTDALEVVLDDHSLAAPETEVGRLFRERSRGNEVVSFAYDDDYLTSASAVQIDPELPRHRTFAARRFDREAGSRRLYLSAMTLLGLDDGDEASYLDIAEAMQLHGAPDRLGDELAQLYRRVVFSILVGNRDDHLRNHGFLRTRGGWVLSPAFDINPNPHAGQHALAIDEADPTPSVASLHATRELYRLREAGARGIEDEVRAAVRIWPEAAAALDITRPERQQLAAVVDPERA